jgi:hypothetical protein
MIGTNIERKASWYKGNGMIMNTTGRQESLGSGKYQLMFREDGLEVLRHRGCLSCLYGMELGNNARMTFFSIFSMRWELMISGEPMVIPWNLYFWPSWSNYMVNSLKSMRMGPTVLSLSAPNTMSQPPMSIENI